MSSPTADATGNLSATPLVELLIFALDRRLNGTIVFEIPELGKAALKLRHGAPNKSRIPAAEHLLGQICIEKRFIEPPKLNAALQSKAPETLTGEHLVKAGLLDRSQLALALEEQVFRHLEWLSNVSDETRYGFFAGQDFLSSRPEPAQDVDPLAAIWRVARSKTMLRAPKFLGQLGNLRLKLHAQSRVGRFAFSNAEKAVLDVLRAKPQSYPSLLGLGLLPEDQLNRILFVLGLTRHLDVGSGGAPMDVDTSASVAAPARRTIRAPRQRTAPPAPRSVHPSTEEEKALVAEIEARLEETTTHNYYELLGVDPEADQSSIQAAFFQLAKKWHPDKLPASLKEHRDSVNKIFSRLSEAHQVLTNPTQRAEYDRLMGDGTTSEEEQARVQEILRAATNFQKAEVLARKADWPGAEKLAKKAFEEDNEQAEYGALYAWAVAKGGKREHDGYGDLLEILDKAHKSQRGNMRIRFYRGQVLMLAGKTSEAMRDFRAVVDVDPNNVDAQRELRLYKMRRGEGADSKESNRPGLLGKLFKK